MGDAGVPGVAFTLQILHASDQEAGLAATGDAPRFSAVMRALEAEYPTRTLKLANGDVWIPGVFYNAGGDPALARVLSGVDAGVDAGFAVEVASAGRADIAMMNAIGWTAASFGNHEFDNGVREISNIIRRSVTPDGGVWVGAQFPYLSANLDFSTTGDLNPAVVANEYVLRPFDPPSALHGRITGSFITYVEGEPVGIVGATTPLLPTIASPQTVVTSPSNPTDFDALAAIIQTRIDALEAKGARIIILMAHMQQFNIEVDELARRLDKVDVIIAGGNHAVWGDGDDVAYAGDSIVLDYPQWKTTVSGQPVAVINVGANWKYVGRFVGSFDARGLLVREAYNYRRSGAYATDDAGVSRLGAQALVNPRVQAVADAVRDVVLAKDGNIAGKTQVYLNGIRASVRTEETNLGNLTADANLWYAKQTDSTVVLSLKNGGGIRDSIGTVGAGATPTFLPPAANPAASKAEGEVSQLDIENSLRFNNGLSVFTLTAANLKDVMEHAVAATNATSTPGQFPQIGGFRIEYDIARTARTTAGTGERIRKLVLLNADGTDGQTIVDNGAVVADASARFRMVTLDFLATGGDSYPFPTFASQPDYNLVNLDSDSGNQGYTDDGREQDALADYLLANFPRTGPGYNQADTPRAMDARIKRL